MKEEQSKLKQSISAQIEKVSQLKSRQKEVDQNIDFLREFLRQASEEMQMTNEDIAAQTIKKAELVS